MPVVRITINGRQHAVDADADMPLLWILRDQLNLTGTKYGCGVGICGACTVLEGSTAVRACQVTASTAAGRRYTTIEGLSPDGSHPCQRAWIETDTAQCGYCQPGMIMSACALLKQSPKPTDAEIDSQLADHVCRCGSYPRIRKAVHRAAELAGEK
ncbi:MAG TPA: (2Fe-2S)-binding protein [Thermoanaerobaculia bacterium]